MRAIGTWWDAAAVCGLTSKLQREKKITVALTRTAVSEALRAPGNRTRRKNNSPNCATRSKHNQTSSAELIRLQRRARDLKKSQISYKELIKTGEAGRGREG
jgi:hypothetical protein